MIHLFWFKYHSWSLTWFTFDSYSIWANFFLELKIFWTIFFFGESTLGPGMSTHDSKRRNSSARSRLTVLLESTPLQEPTLDLIGVDLCVWDRFLNWNVPNLYHPFFNCLELYSFQTPLPPNSKFLSHFYLISCGPCSLMAPRKQLV